MALQKSKEVGKFIVFEGLDGSGQTTQAGLLKDFLVQKRWKVHLTKEPTGNLIGGLIKGQLKGEWRSSAECLQLLFAADRAHHLEKEIIPLLRKGVTVICDRYFFSSIAYGSLEIKDRDWLFDINRQFLLPDLTFILKVSPKICLARIRKSRFETTIFEKEALLAQVLKNYEKLAKLFENVYLINSQRPIPKVFEEVKKIAALQLNLKRSDGNATS